MPERLQRLERAFTPAPIYFVTANTFQRRDCLANVGMHVAFQRFAQVAEGRGIAVGRYVLMPDHLHLFVSLPRDLPGVGLSRWIKSLKNALSAHLRQAGVPAPHWQKGFFDHLMRSDESYADKWEYVAQNPVRAGLVATATVWPFQGEVCRLTSE